MGREVRRVSANWQHPKNDKGEFIPMNRGDFGGGFAKMEAEWNEGREKWLQGLFDDDGQWMPIEDKYRGMTWTGWHGSRPNPDDYMPNWSAEEATHLMMYEDTSEGTPISPAFATPEELAKWLADNGASAFGKETATYEQWLATCRRGWVPSLVMDIRGLRSGVADSEPR